ncbi:MAG: CTP synthase [Veillonella parvula]|nr:CTP synthase [Veillonella parvula]
MATKYIFVTGGVVSSLGKGITAASLGRLLKNRGFNVTIQKFDPYINIDPGTMSPYQHGEVFVTDDGAETDLDLGHYERFIDINLSKRSNITAGKVYWSVINKERKGDYLGSTVQVIPHITNEIKQNVYRVGKEDNADVVMRSIGIQPDILVCRSEKHISDDMKEKLALFCDVEPEAVIENQTCSSIYEVPLMMQDQGLDDIVIKKLGLEDRPCDMTAWKEMVHKILNPNKDITVAIVGKYVALHDAYLSVVEALDHAGIATGTKVNIRWIDSEELDDTSVDPKEVFEGVEGIIVPGGFGSRGVEGKIRTIQYARENNIPYLGLCLGMQSAVMEFARNVCGMEGATSSEFDENAKYKVIDLMSDQVDVDKKGGTMRLGIYPCKVEAGTKTHEAYGEDLIYERHRHRYEFNNEYRQQLTDAGLVISGTSPDGRLVESIEVKNHPFFIGTQAHPELKSRPNNAHPLFRGFVDAILELKK